MRKGPVARVLCQPEFPFHFVIPTAAKRSGGPKQKARPKPGSLAHSIYVVNGGMAGGIGGDATCATGLPQYGHTT